MMLPQDYIAGLQRELADMRAQLKPLEDGTSRIGERRHGGQWEDITAREIARQKHAIATYEGIIARGLT